MRILAVGFRNLNSLVGGWHIDLSGANLGADSIFAITGATGAGKSTILDAVCLALYGATPRLGRISKSSNEIMSRQTGECSAEVVFETVNGRFRCFWYQRRARLRAEGELQSARHEISDAGSGQVLESGLGATLARVERETGMDFHRFTRSMLLAQGGFAAFLLAGPDERSPILEQITGTEIYSRISMKVHEMRAAEVRRLEELQAGFAALRPLAGEELAALENALADTDRRLGELRRDSEDLGALLAWRRKIAELEGQLAGLEQAGAAHLRQLESFAPEARRLRLARQAASLAGEFEALHLLRQRQGNDLRTLAGVDGALTAAARENADLLAAEQAAKAALAIAREAKVADELIARQVRGLDLRIGERQARQQQAEAARLQVLEHRQAAADRVRALAAEEEKAGGELRRILAYQREHRVDGGLAERFGLIERTLADWRQAVAALTRLRQETEKAAVAAEEASRRWEAVRRRHAESARLLAETSASRQGAEEDLARLLDGASAAEIRDDMEAARTGLQGLDRAGEILADHRQAVEGAATLRRKFEECEAETMRLAAVVDERIAQRRLREEQVAGAEKEELLLARIRSLEEERRRLRSGSPCPLCGAVEHPYADGKVPLADDEGKLAQLRRQLAATVAEINGLHEARAALAAEMRHLAGGAEEKERQAATAWRLWREVAAGLGLAAEEPRREAVVVERRAALAGRLERVRQRLAAIDRAGQDVDRLRRAVEAASAAHAGMEQVLLAARHRQEAAREALDSRRAEEQATSREEAAAAEAARQAVAVYGLPLAGDGAGALQELRRRLQHWQEQEEARRRLEQRLSEIGGEGAAEQARLAEAEEQIRIRDRELAQVLLEMKELQAERQRLYDGRDPDREERRLAAAVVAAERGCEQATGARERSGQALAALGEQQGHLRENLRERQQEIADRSGRFASRLADAGFADEDAFLRARLPEEEVERLAGREEELRREEVEGNARLQSKRRELAEERDRRLTGEDGDALCRRLDEVGRETEVLLREKGEREARLRDNRALTERHRAQLQLVEAQRLECQRWELLHGLIGSADGKKYRNFAQGLTFEGVVALANRQLRRMSDRYLLIRAPADPLELSVVDNYQGGEIRSTRNLSGGESFLVSLALALGLARMSSRNVRVDTLFLDEGFGTLDEEALETALETLAGLREEGKLIGVISHVPALKERIAARIEVIPGPGGRSRLAGPGCSRVAP
ncbi:MAG: AAA family ATPase [Thermodesulfobacteriota bacterium]